MKNFAAWKRRRTSSTSWWTTCKSKQKSTFRWVKKPCKAHKLEHVNNIQGCQMVYPPHCDTLLISYVHQISQE